MPAMPNVKNPDPTRVRVVEGDVLRHDTDYPHTPLLMKQIAITLVALCLAYSAQATAQTKVDPPAATGPNAEQEILNLSKTKWRWMSERKVDSLAALFDEQAVFVHMGGTMSRAQELEVIRSGGIHYKHAEIYEASVRFILQ
jgi:Domain of unknown function (DUF4440)